MNKYASVVLWYQEAMGVGSARPFAAVVEHDDDDLVEVVCVWEHIDSADEVTRATLEKFADVLEGYADEAIRNGVRVVDTLVAKLRWNIYASEPETKVMWLGGPSLREYAYQVFESHVDADAESMRKLRDAAGQSGSRQHAYRILQPVQAA